MPQVTTPTHTVTRHLAAVVNDPPAWVTLPAAAARLSLCDRTLRRAIARGELTAYRFGSAVRVRLSDLDAWAESKAAPTGDSTKAR